ncbi:MAG: PEP-CTERM sorting domain-containing protein [Phycisphaerales bacterium]|jgi:probable HAF family extracellular repeat protein
MNPFCSVSTTWRLSFVLCLSASSLWAASFRALGDLPGGDYSSQACAISGDGGVVVGISTSALGQEAFRWTLTGGMQNLGDLAGGGFYSKANAVSYNGDVVVGTSSSALGDEEAFRWTQATGMTGLGGLSGGSLSRGLGVSGDGVTIVGQSVSGSGFEAFRCTSALDMRGLGDLPGDHFESGAYAASSNGSVIAGYGTGPGGDDRAHLAFRWTESGGMANLGFLAGGIGSIAYDIAADGTIVGMAYGLPELPPPNNFTCVAFRQLPGGDMVSLGDLAGGVTDTRAFGVSGDGRTVVGYGYSDRGQEAFIWDETHNMRSLQSVLISDYSLDLDGWRLQVAQGISDDGMTIVGWGTNPVGQTEAWMVTLSSPQSVPAPGAAILAIVGCSCLAKLRRRCDL